MSSEIKNNQGTSGSLSFRDEIFQWPIAKMVNTDVWELMVDNYLTNPLDRKNLLLASPQLFGPFLEDKKCSILLGEVLHILHKNNYLNLRSNAEFLKYRNLSKDCKISIDTCLKLDNPCFQNLDGIDHDHDNLFLAHPRRFHCWEVLSRPPSDMTKKINLYASMIRKGTAITMESSPFPCGFLAFPPTYALGNRDVILQFLKNYRLILPALGTTISHFRFEMSKSTWSDYRLLLEFLGMMPNLQSFSLENFYRSCDSPEVRRKLPQLEDYPLPILDNLEVLKTKSVPTEIVGTLIKKYGRHLKKILVDTWAADWKYVYENGIFSPAINLTELSLPWIATSLNIGQYLRDNVKQISTLKCISVRIAVEKAELERTGAFQELTSALSELFESSKLHTLNLFAENRLEYRVQNKFLDNDVRLKLPTLRRLWIQSQFDVIFSIDFILGVSSSLEELVLSMAFGTYEPVDRGQREIIQFKDCWNKMEESNVWILMPMLKKITIRNENSTNPEYISSRPLIISDS